MLPAMAPISRSNHFSQHLNFGQQPLPSLSPPSVGAEHNSFTYFSQATREEKHISGLRSKDRSQTLKNLLGALDADRADEEEWLEQEADKQEKRNILRRVLGPSTKFLGTAVVLSPFLIKFLKPLLNKIPKNLTSRTGELTKGISAFGPFKVVRWILPRTGPELWGWAVVTKYPLTRELFLDHQSASGFLSNELHVLSAIFQIAMEKLRHHLPEHGIAGKFKELPVVAIVQLLENILLGGMAVVGYANFVDDEKGKPVPKKDLSDFDGTGIGRRIRGVPELFKGMLHENVEAFRRVKNLVSKPGGWKKILFSKDEAAARMDTAAFVMYLASAAVGVQGISRALAGKAIKGSSWKNPWLQVISAIAFLMSDWGLFSVARKAWKEGHYEEGIVGFLGLTLANTGIALENPIILNIFRIKNAPELLGTTLRNTGQGGNLLFTALHIINKKKDEKAQRKAQKQEKAELEAKKTQLLVPSNNAFIQPMAPPMMAQRHKSNTI